MSKGVAFLKTRYMLMTCGNKHLHYMPASAQHTQMQGDREETLIVTDKIVNVDCKGQYCMTLIVKDNIVCWLAARHGECVAAQW